MPHYSDYTKHLRRGDIVISWPEGPAEPDANNNDNDEFVYGHFELQKTQNKLQLISKTWMPASMELYKIVNNIRKTFNPRVNKKYSWEIYLEEGIKSLGSEELDCRRPAEDKLFFTVGERNIVEVNHPEDQTGVEDRRQFGLPNLRFGKVAGGEKITRDESIRHTLWEQNNVICFDSDMDQVMESIEGNRKDSFIIIRSITDYHDGTTSKEWQAYSSLCAAAMCKTIICSLPPFVPSPY